MKLLIQPDPPEQEAEQSLRADGADLMLPHAVLGNFSSGGAGGSCHNCSQRQKYDVMTAISKKHGFNSPAQGIVISLPIEDTLGLEK